MICRSKEFVTLLVQVVSKPGVYTVEGMKDGLPPYQRDPTPLPVQLRKFCQSLGVIWWLKSRFY